ncbi:GGDEF domain-containing protein [Zooshikella harenae]|uniref:diguanylate cyclase n=1 Tax=Zooshikella harenae TaxID=2827238 RepID=A0ABS5ZL44_9GAMM|nr:GGDEF domain-containing protein [Zooshikella harenae]MBU2714076.1 GGDEF domain-containing protein [Zooshikella harenae]
MVSFKISGFSSRIKYLLIVILTLLPFSAVLIFVGFIAYLPAFQAMDDMNKVVMKELVPLSELQRSLLNAAMPPNDYIIHKGDDEKQLFAKVGKEVDVAFLQLQAAYKDRPDKLETIKVAYTSWLHVFKDGQTLMSYVDHSDYDSANKAMEKFDANIQVVVDNLNQVHEKTQVELIRHNAQVVAMEDKGILITILAFVTTLIFGIFGSIWLTKRNKSLENQSMHDQLTGAFNRHACDEKFQDLTRTTVSLERKLFSLIMMDIDYFKSVNDTYGHQVGDEALKVVAHVIENHLRGSDFFARFGGEEFIIIIPGTEKHFAKEMADRLRIAIMETPIKASDEENIYITMSFGVAEFPLDSSNQTKLIDCADQALYKAKEMGRNQVVVYGERAKAEQPSAIAGEE